MLSELSTCPVQVKDRTETTLTGMQLHVACDVTGTGLVEPGEAVVLSSPTTYRFCLEELPPDWGVAFSNKKTDFTKLKVCLCELHLARHRKVRGTYAVDRAESVRFVLASVGFLSLTAADLKLGRKIGKSRQLVRVKRGVLYVTIFF